MDTGYKTNWPSQYATTYTKNSQSTHCGIVNLTIVIMYIIKKCHKLDTQTRATAGLFLILKQKFEMEQQEV